MQDDFYEEYEVTHRISRTESVVTLWLAPKKGERPDFIPGQFVNVKDPTGGPEAKSYTIGSTPEDPGVSLTIRAHGSFSRALVSLPPGEPLFLSGPLGYFYPIDSETPRICLAGGIGVMPFASFVRASIEEGSSPPTELLYSERTTDGLLFQDLFFRLAQEDKNFQVRYFLTRDREGIPGAAHRRIGREDMDAMRQKHPHGHFFLCGGIPFVRDMRLLLKEAGVPEESIFTESFF